MNLIILTRQFGNYTGATVSTIQLLKRINKYFNQIEVLTLKTDGTVLDNVQVHVFENLKKLKLFLSNKNLKKWIGYSDDHLGYLFKENNIKYVHTYHGNWPDARWISLDMFFKAFYFMPLYKKTIKNAAITIDVSKYMQQHYTSKITSNCQVIYNGIKQGNANISESNRSNFLMVGNIDKRKYAKAVDVFKFFPTDTKIKIDIYGKVMNQHVAKKLKSFSFVNLKGETGNINFSKYSGMLSTSISENLPVSIVEALEAETPVISFDVGGINEVISNGINGFLVKKGDISDFVKKINLSYSYRFSFTKKESLKNTFNWDTASLEYLKVFKKVVESND